MSSPRPLANKLATLLDELECARQRRRRCIALLSTSQQHTLLVWPPGTAKSQLARRLHLAFEDARYFERLLTRFSVPEELFGPLSISALEQDRYERHTAGYLPQASIAFIDEVFKANSAILNALLTLLNERQFDNGAGRQDCPLISVIGATNEVPLGEVAEAFFDRFLVRLPVAPVSAGGFRELLALDAHRPLRVTDALVQADRDAIASAALEVGVPEEVATLLAELRQHLEGGQIYVSDRRWIKILALLRVAAAAEARGLVSGICQCCRGARRTM
jgi:MoxR-like ATPase